MLRTATAKGIGITPKDEGGNIHRAALAAVGEARTANATIAPAETRNEPSSGDRAVFARELPRLAQSSLEDFLFHFGTDPIVLFRLNGEILWMSPETHHGLSTRGLLQECGLRLAMPDEETQAAFDGLIRSGLPAKRFFVRGSSDSDWIVLRAYPCVADGRPARIVRIAYPTPETSCRENGLSDVFHLTRSETAILDLFSKLRSPRDVALELGLARETVRSHLKRIYNKTGIRNGRELIQLVAAFGQP
ncbi:MAG: helix-turn-helix transcriptional regulator [Erythrobacter sp.]